MPDGNICGDPASVEFTEVITLHSLFHNTKHLHNYKCHHQMNRFVFLF